MNALMLFMLTVTCTAAAGLEIRCMMKKSIPDNSLSLAGRRIKVAGYTFLTIRFVDLWITGGMIYAPSAIALLMIAFADCIRCSNRLHLPASAFGSEART